MRKLIFALILPLVVVSGLLLANREIKNETSEKPVQKQLSAAENGRFEAQERAESLNTAKYREQLMQQYVRTSTTAFQGIERAAQAMTSKAKGELKDMGKFGTDTMNEFQKNSTAAFQQIGTSVAQNQPIAQAAASAMKGFFLNMIGDRAEAEGALLLLSSIWPPNPLGLAAGGGLVALGAALKSAAGSAGSGVSSSGVGGGGITLRSAGIGKRAGCAAVHKNQIAADICPSGTLRGILDPNLHCLCP